ncbi:RNA helicase [Malassezia psittaci]|uniref:ATP-dependent DNA helicase CHL1 n=1 Tax=Malassezia psittaci TaxID=1821823 RepID=A0AAF0FEJ9_9BASI|nr:RNA helicase [Malassezia psittaci]
MEGEASGLSLSTPGGEDDTERSQAFHFPYSVAYDVQLALMSALFEAIEHRRAGVFESPTGTGKTLSLLCSALTWLEKNKNRAEIGTIALGSDEPDWVIQHEQAKQRERLIEQEQQLNARLQRVRQEKQQQNTASREKKRRLNDGQDESDDDFLISEYDEQSTKKHNTVSKADMPFLSDEVLAMIDTLKSHDVSSSNDLDTEQGTSPQIYYASRTHSQLSQLISELKRTPFGQDPDNPVRTISLGSRKQMCIHRQANVHDIEELVNLGKQTDTCPYYGVRRALPQAQLITLPYNLLLQRDARDALALKLEDSVVIIDEAHNLIDTILNTYSLEISQDHIQQATLHVKTYLDRFSMRLRGSNEEYIRTLREFLDALSAFCSRTNSQNTMTTSDFVASLGGSIDQINDTRIARKISGYADKLWQRQNPEKIPSRRNKVHAMNLVEQLLLALGDRTGNGRILIEIRADKRVWLKYILLNPADVFQPLLESARSVILAGGTMEPISEFQTQLFSQVKDRFTSYSCDHIVERGNVLGAVVQHGPKGTLMEFKHSSWSDEGLLEELGNALCNYANIVPHGMVVFFPSYGNLHTTMAHWKKTQVLSRLEKRKRVFFEPTDAHQVDSVLQSYTAAITNPTADARRGAILFAVVNAKLSEGINFQDDLARCVVMIGLPFPNAQSKELSERMEYLRRYDLHHKTDSGRELYLNLCMRAVNQSMGRAIRHRNDYVCLPRLT